MIDSNFLLSQVRASTQRVQKTVSLHLVVPTTFPIPLSSGKEPRHGHCDPLPFLNLIKTILKRRGSIFLMSVDIFQCARVGGGRGEWRPGACALPSATQLPHSRGPLWHAGTACCHSDSRHRQRGGDHSGLQPDRLGRECNGEQLLKKTQHCILWQVPLLK